jgi:hypothetical protein
MRSGNTVTFIAVADGLIPFGYHDLLDDCWSRANTIRDFWPV